MFLVWPPSERVDGLQDDGIDARFYEIVLRPVSVFENVMQHRGAQLERRRIRTKCLRNIKRVSQVQLARIVSTMVSNASAATYTE